MNYVKTSFLLLAKLQSYKGLHLTSLMMCELLAYVLMGSIKEIQKQSLPPSSE